MKHKHTLIAAAAMLVTSAAFAQPAPGLLVDASTLPTPDGGTTSLLVSNTTTKLPTDSDCDRKGVFDCGAMRINCRLALAGPDDPIINRSGLPYQSHWHNFAGNTDTDELTDVTVNPQDLQPGQASTCSGGSANLSRYWVPALMNVRTGKMLHLDDFAPYYKGEMVNPFPPNFNFIHGNAAASTPQSQGIIRFVCDDNTADGYKSSLQGLNCPVGAGSSLRAEILFPDCVAMDGVRSYGTMSGTPHTSAGWRWQMITLDGTWGLGYLYPVKGDVTNIAVSGGGGAAAPTVTTEAGDSLRHELAWVRFVDLTAGQSITIAGLTYTSTGDTSAEEVMWAFAGGRPLNDSENHKSHVAGFERSSNPVLCPVSHPYRIPNFKFNVHYLIGDNDTKDLRFVSDTYSGPGGYSFHGDVSFGWEPSIIRSWINSCNRRGTDCHSNRLGCFDENNNPATCRIMTGGN